MFRTKKFLTKNPNPEYKESKNFQRIAQAISPPKIKIPSNIREFVKYLSLSELNKIEMEAKQPANLIRKFIKEEIKKDYMPTFNPNCIKIEDIFNFLTTPVSGANIGGQLLMMATSPILTPIIYTLILMSLIILKAIAMGTVSLVSQFSCSATLYKSFVPFDIMPPALINGVNGFTHFLRSERKTLNTRCILLLKELLMKILFF